MPYCWAYMDAQQSNMVPLTWEGDAMCQPAFIGSGRKGERSLSQ
jgi:hypothetical protein